jgi:hypothetical protein
MRMLLADAGQLTHAQAMQFTWHSMKVSMVNEGLQQGEEPMTVGLQGHWKDPNGPMPNKYTRRRLDKPLAMVRRICGKQRRVCQAGFLYGLSSQQALRGQATVHLIKPSESHSLCGRVQEQQFVQTAPVEWPLVCRHCRAAHDGA